MKETNILQLCRLEASKCGAIVFRMNTGKLQDTNGRWVSFGFPGMSDLIGVMNDGTGRFVAIEVKVPGRKATTDQQAFILAVQKAGGIAGVCCSAEDVRKLLSAL